MGQTAAGDWGCKGFMDGVITCGSKNNKTLLKQRNMMRVFFGARGFALSGSSASGSGRGGWIVAPGVLLTLGLPPLVQDEVVGLWF